MRFATIRSLAWVAVISASFSSCASVDDSGGTTRHPSVAGLTLLGVNEQGYREYTLDMDPSVILIHVPRGSFAMGSDAPEADPDERPVHEVELGAYFIAKNEITNEQYRRFTRATGYPEPSFPDYRGYDDWPEEWVRRYEELAAQMGRPFRELPDHPVGNVTWEDAQAYCRWAGLRLPTEAEWEFAARGQELRQYPWGSNSSEGRANWSGNDEGLRKWFSEGGKTDWLWDGYLFSAPVGSFLEGAGPLGTLDQAGNVWEWTSDWYATDYAGGQVRDPGGPETGSERAIRGGSWENRTTVLRGANRSSYRPSRRNIYLGFRPARAP